MLVTFLSTPVRHSRTLRIDDVEQYYTIPRSVEWRERKVISTSGVYDTLN
jgi:hypothetical protein